jgi:NCK-associated protein 1
MQCVHINSSFYTRHLEAHFQQCLEMPSQTRFAIAFPLACTHFMHSLHDLCPEERHHVGEKSLSLCNVFLDEMCKEAKNIITNICNEYCTLADQLLPKNVARLIAEAMEKRRRQMSKAERKAAERGETQAQQQLHVTMPGDETYRTHREQLTS